LQPPNVTAADFFPAAKVAFPPTASGPTKQEIASAAPLSATKVAAPRERWRSQATREFELALDDPDPGVRRNALLAAAWQGQRWVLDYCRTVAARPSPDNWDALLLLAIIGQAEDLPRVLAIGRCAERGPRRFAALGAYGHPQGMSDLMAAMEGKDLEIALAAAAAFEKITGVDVSGASGSTDAPPHSGRATQVWQTLQARFPGAVRWCRGHDISRGAGPEIIAGFDLESRWEACLRGRFVKGWEARRLDNEQLADALHAEMPS
jgi:hypothetical protein